VKCSIVPHWRWIGNESCVGSIGAWPRARGTAELFCAARRVQVTIYDRYDAGGLLTRIIPVSSVEKDLVTRRNDPALNRCVISVLNCNVVKSRFTPFRANMMRCDPQRRSNTRSEKVRR